MNCMAAVVSDSGYLNTMIVMIIQTDRLELVVYKTHFAVS